MPVVRVQSVSKVNVADEMFYDLTTARNHNYLAGRNTLVFVHNTVIHLFTGEAHPDPDGLAALVHRVFSKFRVPYISITPTYSVCPEHGYLSGEHFTCPKCGKESEVYSRIVGYYRPVKAWSDGKQAEYRDRKVFDL